MRRGGDEQVKHYAPVSNLMFVLMSEGLNSVQRGFKIIYGSWRAAGFMREFMEQSGDKFLAHCRFAANNTLCAEPVKCGGAHACRQK
jgi:hypothetical protein